MEMGTRIMGKGLRKRVWGNDWSWRTFGGDVEA